MSALPQAPAFCAVPSGTALPRAPQAPAATGLPETFLVELVAKAMFEYGLTRLTELTQHLALSGAVIDAVCQFMRREGLIEVTRRGQTEADVQYELSGAGSARAIEWLTRNRYAGPAPVTLEAYTRVVQAQAITQRRVTVQQVRTAFADLVIPDGLADLLGTAVNSGRPLLLYGPPGAGKTYLAGHLQRLLTGPVAIPYAIAVHGEVIRVFDEHWHHPAAARETGPAQLDNAARPDPRWVLCERPLVVSGGELTLQMLDLAFDERAGYYEAPPHFKANNGLFIVDDLGRQVVTPRELMNRWIVPMDRREDYLMLRSGGKFKIPFDMVLVFCSNLRPSELEDMAFLRRIGHKVHVGPLAVGEYREIFKRVCVAEGIAFDEASFQGLLRDYHATRGQPLLACYPRDLLQLIASRAAYLGVTPQLSPALIDWAWNVYFAAAEEDTPPPGMTPLTQME
ncbi:MAG TPA: ATP-binding protein [Albitalea sp.]|nr:ATP-binding protein [Albitalea sp.]